MLMFFNSIIDNKLHPLNILNILVTEDASKFVKLIDFNELHPENIEDILIA